jgi:hypothetical protein
MTGIKSGLPKYALTHGDIDLPMPHKRPTLRLFLNHSKEQNQAICEGRV